MNKYLKNFPTQNLIFKPISTEDIDVIYEGFSESFTSLNQYYSPAWAQFETKPSKQKMSNYWNDCIQYFRNDESYLFSIFGINDNKFIGHGEIHHYDPSVPKARLGYWVRDSATRKGYATEIAKGLTDFGFNALKCERLEIRNDVRNPASGKIAHKVGYKFLTVFEKNKQGKKGDFWDLEIYALTRDQYNDQS